MVVCFGISRDATKFYISINYIDSLSLAIVKKKIDI